MLHPHYLRCLEDGLLLVFSNGGSKPSAKSDTIKQRLLEANDSAIDGPPICGGDGLHVLQQKKLSGDRGNDEDDDSDSSGDNDE